MYDNISNEEPPSIEDYAYYAGSGGVLAAFVGVAGSFMWWVDPMLAITVIGVTLAGAGVGLYAAHRGQT